jgi:sec-independent protein translocase protein TatB
MFDIGFFELCIIGVVALLVLGPERLPRAARTAGMWVGRAKRMVTQVKRDIDDELRQEELAELREARESLSKTRESMDSFQKDLSQQIDTGDEPDKGDSATKQQPEKPATQDKAAAGAPADPGPNETRNE